MQADKLRPSSLKRNHEALHAFFSFVRKKGHIVENPLEDIRPPRLPEREIRFLSLEQIDACLQAVRGDLLAPLVTCAIYSGLRREELCWLLWEDVDLTPAKPLLQVRSKTVDGLSWMPKTKRNRYVPIHSRLLGVLLREQRKRRRSPWVFPSPWGRRWHPDNLGHRLVRLMKSLGLPWGFLVFRHTYGSQLATNGVSLYKISKLMGNSARVAERHYASLLTQDLHEDIEFGVGPR